MKISTLLLSTTIALAMGTGAFAATSHHQTGTAVGTIAKPIKTPSKKPVFESSVAGWGYYDATSLSFTGTPLDTETVNCKGNNGCTLEMSAMVQQCSFDGEYAANLYAMWVLVDGTFVDNGPYAGGTNTAHPCDIQNWQGLYGVAAGSHSVEFAAYEGGATYIAEWSDRTDVLKN